MKQILKAVILVIFLTGLIRPDAATAVFEIDAAWHRQQHSLSCEVASLKIALSAVGVEVSEQQLINQLAFDPTPKGNGVWGDPDLGFVGRIDGRMLVTGYGVHWDPIAKVGLRYRRTQALTNAKFEQIISELKNGNPVIVWGYYGKGEKFTWQTPQGKTINAVNSEHARVLVGYTGDSQNLGQLILLDPIYGKQNWDKDIFLANWGSLGNGAVVVYNSPRWIKNAESPTVWEVNKEGLVKYPLAMSWDKFTSEGGTGEGIVTVSMEKFNAIGSGQSIDSLLQ